MDFGWVTIHVRDMGESLKFYQEIVGLKISRRMKPRPDMEIVFLETGKTEIELIRDGAKPSFGNDISLGFRVDSVDDMIEILAAKNIPVHSGPFQPGPAIRFFYVLDPDGLKIQFFENIRV